MNKQVFRNRKVVWSLLLLFSSHNGILFLSSFEAQSTPKEPEYRMRTAMEKSDFQLFGDKSQYVLAPSNKGSLFVSKTYAITDEYKTFIVEDEKKATYPTSSPDGGRVLELDFV